MSSVQDGWQGDSQVDREADGRRMPAVETVGDEAVSAAMTRRNEPMARVLLIEDDKETADEIRAELGDCGFDVDWAANGIEGLDKARSGEAEAMIVDRLLPGMDGLTIIEALRHEGTRTPVLVLSALAAVDDRVADCAPEATTILPSRSRQSNSSPGLRHYCAGRRKAAIPCCG
jgi:CheY-like chemotaxis protein